MTIEAESQTVLVARSAILKALQGSRGTVTLPPTTVADAFPGTDRTERSESMLDWAEINKLSVKSHRECDPEDMCEEWPCGPIDFEVVESLP